MCGRRRRAVHFCLAHRSPTEITAFSDRLNEFKEIGCNVRVTLTSAVLRRRQSAAFLRAPASSHICMRRMHRRSQVVGCSVDSHFTHLVSLNVPTSLLDVFFTQGPITTLLNFSTSLTCLVWTASSQAWVNTPRTKGGLGGCSYPLLADLTKQVARDYEVLIEEGGDAGVALRCASRVTPGTTLWWLPVCLPCLLAST